VQAIFDLTVIGVAKPDPLSSEITSIAPLRRPRTPSTWATRPVPTSTAPAAGVRPVLIDPYDFHPDLDVERVSSLVDGSSSFELASPPDRDCRARLAEPHRRELHRMC
jgi:hypothetical protein